MTHERNIYLHDVSLDQALDAWHAALDAHRLRRPLSSEIIPLTEALGRVTAQPVWARISSPHYHAAAMDGYAVRAEETRGASETSPKVLPIDRRAMPVDTGDPMPPDTNAVIMIEDTQTLPGPDGSPHIEIMAAVAPWQHVRAMGEDMVATELVLPANHRLRP